METIRVEQHSCSGPFWTMRPWPWRVRNGTRSVRATRCERTRVLPGDSLIASPIGSITHAVTIRRTPHDVWPWLVQMGGGRAGWYSYDFIDNGGRRSDERIVPELQHIETGMLFPAMPGAADGFTMAAYERDRFLVIGWQTQGTWVMTWSFVLEAIAHEATRLVVRVRGGRGYRFHRLPWWLAKGIVRVVHYIMERKQLLSIARRAEREPFLAGPQRNGRRTSIS